MTTVIIVATVVVLLVAFYLLLRPTIAAYRKYSGPMVVTCPATKQPVSVEVDVKHAVSSEIFGHKKLRLSQCSRWSEYHECDQACLRQIEVMPEDCLIKTKLTKWYEGKSCAVCRTPFGEIHWHDHRPALMTPEGKTIEWHEVHPENISNTLETHRPVCWNCHIMTSFITEHGDLVILRDWHPMEAYPEE